jgi:hypothetical protein
MHTTDRTVSRWPSPAQRMAQGCFLWAGLRLHILTVLSAEADARISGFVGETSKSLTSLSLLVGVVNPYPMYSLHHALSESVSN